MFRECVRVIPIKLISLKAPDICCCSVQKFFESTEKTRGPISYSILDIPIAFFICRVSFWKRCTQFDGAVSKNAAFFSQRFLQSVLYFFLSPSKTILFYLPYIYSKIKVKCQHLRISSIFMPTIIYPLRYMIKIQNETPQFDSSNDMETKDYAARCEGSRSVKETLS